MIPDFLTKGRYIPLILALGTCLGVYAQPREPYAHLHDGEFSGRKISESPDPLVNFIWHHPVAGDSLQIYTLYPKKLTGVPSNAFEISGNPKGSSILVSGKGSLLVDFGVESAGWLEFDSDDGIDSVEMSISEYNEPEIVNAGALNPVKTKRPVRYGSAYRLELNPELYEGVRFGWIHVHHFSKPWHIRNIRLVCQVKPVNYLGQFSCSDPELTRIWYTGAYVVKLNLLQNYFGSILTERSDRISWTGDAYPSQAASLAAFGNYAFVKKNLLSTAKKDNGIPSYSLYWVLSLIDYFNYTGDTAFLNACIPIADKKLKRAFDQFDTLPPLTFMGHDERLGATFEDPQIPEAQNTYKMLCIGVWRQFAATMRFAHNDDLAQKYTGYAAAKLNSLESTQNCFNQYGVHAVSEAIKAGIQDTTINRLRRVYYADRLNRLSYSPFNQYFILQALAMANDYPAALTTVKDCWGGQLRYGGTTFFEIYRPSWNKILKPNDPPPNSQSGYTSLAHPWGAGVTKWLSEEILGIRPVAPGFRHFEIIPHLGTGVTWVSGKMPTPAGVIQATFNINTGNCSVSIPQYTVADRIAIPKAGRSIGKIEVNGKLGWDSSEEDQQFLYLLHLKPGEYKIKVQYTGAAPGVAGSEEKWNYLITQFRQDSITSGAWQQSYGREGYMIFGYAHGDTTAGKLPAYVKKIAFKKDSVLLWNAQTPDPRALRPPHALAAQASALVTRDPEATLETMTMDIELKDCVPHRLSLYFLDFDNQQRRTAIEIFDLNTLNLIAPVQLVQHYEHGKYLTFTIDRSVRVRINQVRGVNAAVSGIFFDKPAIQ
jgi:alpha-L-rhamnosidase